MTLKDKIKTLFTTGILYDSKIAKLLLMKDFSTITICFVIVTTLTKLAAQTISHERIHVKQYIDCAALGVIIACLCLFFTTSWLLLLIPLLLFYVMYCIEWLVSFVAHLIRDNDCDNTCSYFASAMEMEAYANQNNYTYYKTRMPFAFFKYYGTICSEGALYKKKGFYVTILAKR